MDFLRRSGSDGMGGLMDQPSKVFNDFFYRSEGERPQWMRGSEGSVSGVQSDEEKLLDDANDRYISRTSSIDSSRNYSRTCSLESESYFNDVDEEAEVVLRVPMCCGSCENKVKSLTQMEGVTSVACTRRTEKVTVIGSARPRDILEACKKLFEQARLWDPEDDALLGL